MFELFIPVGFASLYVWYLLGRSTILDRPMAWPREHWGPLVGCPWCAGFWITGTILVILHLTDVVAYDWLTHLAAAGLVGVVGEHA